MTAQDYINLYAPYAVADSAKSGVPASITLAQGLLESNNGNSQLFTNGDNSFGIKCAGGWTGATQYANDDLPNECFRSYDSVAQSFSDHSLFLQTQSRYSNLFSFPITDYKSWANGLQQDGYATSPTYAQSLINIIEQYNLQQYDVQAQTKQTQRFVFIAVIVFVSICGFIYLIRKKAI